MKPLGLVSQILALVLAVAIAFLFVRPTFSEIGALQTDIQNYKTERQRVVEINQLLASKVAILEGVSPDNVDRITTYMPSYVDEVKVLRDLQSIADSSGVIYSAIQFDKQFGSQSSVDQDLNGGASEPVPYSFTVGVEGNYSNIKSFLSALEQNHYPLQIYNADLSSTEGDFMLLTTTIVTYVDEKEASELQDATDNQELYE